MGECGIDRVSELSIGFVNAWVIQEVIKCLTYLFRNHSLGEKIAGIVSAEVSELVIGRAGG